MSMSSVDVQTKGTDAKLAELLARINSLGGNEEITHPGQAMGGPSILPSEPEKGQELKEYVPWAPESLEEAKLTESEVEAIILKFLLVKGTASGHQTADQIKLPFRLMQPIYSRMKLEQLIHYKSATHTGDYILELTDVGRERARRYTEVSSYFGSAPVTLKDYTAAVAAQSLTLQRPKLPQLQEAFQDLLITPGMLDRLGPAISAGKGMFLYGYPGNGKTSIAERVTRAFGPTLWIPRSISVDGEIIRLFDPVVHEECPVKDPGLVQADRNLDHRWVRIIRPTVVVGGELTMDQLEICFNPTTGIGEAPLQMKSNCGTLVVDDFGRQRMSTDELLNRWIVPLEKRYDFLNTLSGKKIQVPFDQLIVFSTNLEPRDLVDDAFLRRIPYKIEVKDPSEDDFRKLFQIMCDKLGIPFEEKAITYLIEKHYKPIGRPFRNCQPRDLLLQIKYYCEYLDQPPQLTSVSIDFAVENYFSIV
jgi:hypothetical protein